MRSGFKICYLKKKTLLLSGHQGLHGSHRSFSDSSVGKESACSAGDPCSVPGSRRSPGEEIGYSLQYSWTFLVAQLVKNLPTMRETWVQSLGWEDPLGEEKGYGLLYSGLENSVDCTVPGVAKSQPWLSEFHFSFSMGTWTNSSCLVIKFV